MTKIVWGIILAVFGILSFAAAAMGTNPQGPTGSVIGGFLFVGGGGALIYFGQRQRSMKQHVSDGAFRMLRDQARIDAGVLANSLSLNETDVRQIIAE